MPVRQALLDEAREIFPTARSFESGDSFILATDAVERHHQGGRRVIVAVDGSFSDRPVAFEGQGSSFVDRPEPVLLATGVAALLDSNGTLSLLASASGACPIFATRLERGIVFGTHLVPLFRILTPDLDLIAITEFMVRHVTTAGRTFHAGVRRLLPGQRLNYELKSGRAELIETSQLWADETPGASNPHEGARLAWDGLCRAAETAIGDVNGVGLMLSGGYDSRTILAALREVASDRMIFTYTFGHPKSRDRLLASRLARLAGASQHTECDIVGADFEPTASDAGAPHFEALLFPEWARAAATLERHGANVLLSGVFGEVLGGHYGLPPATAIDRMRSAFPASAHFREQPIGGQNKLSDLANRFRFGGDSYPWFLAPEHGADWPPWRATIRKETTGAFERLHRRGVRTVERLAEAFLSEYRAAQYPAAQPLAGKAFLEPALPLADGRLLGIVTSLPFSWRELNRMTREILRRWAPDLAKLPTAASPAPVRWPIPLQESGRFLRVVNERAARTIRGSLSPEFPLPRSGGWDIDVEDVRGSLRQIAQSLRSPIWNAAAFGWRVTKAGHEKRDTARSVTPIILRILLKAHTVDRLVGEMSEPGTRDRVAGNPV